jgi:hypothetical protein
MASKKRRRLTRKQIKAQRRAAIERKRRERNWAPPVPSSAPPMDEQDEIIADMLPLLSQDGDLSAVFDPDMGELMQVLVASDDLLEEPEFREVFANPLRCVRTISEVAEELGTDPDAIMALPAEERDEVRASLFEEVMRRQLSEELKQDILQGLNDLRLRMKRVGKPKKAAKAATLQSFLTIGEDGGSWTGVGLVRAILQRSLEAGFSILEVSVEVTEPEESGEGTPSLLQRLRRSQPSETAEGLLNEIPGLVAYLRKQSDSAWKEGLEAVRSGELCLDLFSAEELQAGFEIVSTGLGYGSGEAAAAGVRMAEPTPEDVKATGQRMGAFLTEMFTPARFEQLRARLDAILNEETLPRAWLAFVLLLAQRMEEEDAAEYEKPFLLRAFLGEMRVKDEAEETVGTAGST